MNVMKKLLIFLVWLSRNPGKLLTRETLNSEHIAEAWFHQEVADKYALADGLPTIDLLDLFPSFSETIEPYSFLEWTSLPTDLALLKGLARRHKSCRYLEIGTWRGESVSNVASVASMCVTISLSRQEMQDTGLPSAFVDSHGFFSKRLKNVEAIEHNSQTFDFSRLQGKFDLVFVDGDHSYEGVRRDTENVFKVRRNSSSIIVWHDYGYGTESTRWTVLAAILAGCPAEGRKHLYHVSNTMCAIYIEQDFPTKVLKFPHLPDKSFKLDISAHKLPTTSSTLCDR